MIDANGFTETELLASLSPKLESERQGRQYSRYPGRETAPAGGRSDALLVYDMMDHLRALHASLISKRNPVNLRPRLSPPLINY
jgi:hypothetical protein